MGADFEFLITDSLQRRAATVRIPADLAVRARRARTQRRRRQYVLRSGLTAVTAAGLAVVVPLATQTGPQQPGSSTLPAQTTAYIARQAVRSITTAGAKDIEVEREVYPPTPAGVPQRPCCRDAGNPMRSSTVTWTYGAAIRQEVYAPGGRPLEDNTIVFPTVFHGKDRAGLNAGTDYVYRTWWHIPLSASDPTSIGPPNPPVSCQPAGQLLSPLLQLTSPIAAASRQALRYLLHCGFLRLAGRQDVAGIDALKMISGHVPISLSPALTVVVWLNPATFLPIQSLFFPTADPRQWVRAYYRWLPATPRNLALLNVPVPAGFQRVHFQETPP